VQATAHDAAMMMQNQQPQVSAPSRHLHGQPDAAMTQYQQPQYHDASMMMQNQQPQVSAPSNHHHGPTNAQGTVLLNQQGGSYNAAMNQQPYCTLTGESLLPQQGAKDGASHNAAQHPLQPVPPELDKGAAALAQPQATANVSEMQTDTLHPGCAKDTTPQVVAQSREALISELLRETGVNTADAAQGSSTAMIGGSKDPIMDKATNTKALPVARKGVKKRDNVLVSFCCFVIGFYQHLTRMRYGFVIHYIDIEKTSSNASTNA